MTSGICLHFNIIIIVAPLILTKLLFLSFSLQRMTRKLHASAFLVSIIIILITLFSNANSILVIKHATNQTKPLPVGVQIIVDDVSSVRVIDQDFRLDYYVILNWTIDSATCMRNLKKLISSKGRQAVPSVGDEIVLTGPEVAMFFWIPDPFPVDAKKLESPSTQPLLRIKILQEPLGEEEHLNSTEDFPFDPNQDEDQDHSSTDSLHKLVWNPSPPENMTSGADRKFCSFQHESR